MSQIPGELRLDLLGGFRLERAGVAIETSERGRRLLAALAVLGPMSRGHLAGLLWPDTSEARALGSLRTAVWRLRGIGPDLVEAPDDHLRLGHRIVVDVTALLARGARLLRSDRVEAGDLDRASLPPGELLPGWTDDWIRFERERVRQLRLHALEAQARLLRDRGRIADAQAAAEEAIRAAPLRESAHHVLIEVLLTGRDAGRARRHYAAFRSALGAELGVEPSARLSALVGQPA